MLVTMADDRLRALERRWREGGTDDDARALVGVLRRVEADEAALLARCVALAIPRPRGLEVAAWLSHRPAMALAEPEADRPLVTQQDLAAVFDVTEAVVDGWHARGCPRRRGNRRVAFDLRAVREWCTARGLVPEPSLVVVRGCAALDPAAGLRAVRVLDRGRRAPAIEGALDVARTAFEAHDAAYGHRIVESSLRLKHAIFSSSLRVTAIRAVGQAAQAGRDSSRTYSALADVQRHVVAWVLYRDETLPA